MDEGDAGLLLEGIQILHDGVLGLAHVDDHLGAGAQEGLQIQLALAAVELAQQGQIVVLGGQVLLSARVPLVGNAYQLVGAQGEEHHLGQRAGDRHAGDLRGHLHGAAHGVGEGGGAVLGLGGGGHRRRGVCGGALRGRGAAAGGQPQSHTGGEQERKRFLHVHCSSSSFSINFSFQDVSSIV